ncbi:MAG: SPOR domain-containing protein [Wenzhouxiangella sp.]|nr:MAG: SPOR domain-containing protein [Wenzhouxiangella sp.]
MIALAVIFVPMLFDSDGARETVRDSAIDLPPPPSDRREVRRLPLDPERAREVPSPPAEPAEPAVPDARESEIALIEPEPGDDVPEPETQPEPVPDAPAPAEPDSPPPEAAAEPEPTAPSEPDPVPPASSAGDWLVQVASFSSATTADQVMEQLGRLGHEAGVDVMVRGEARLHRVSTGPYESRTQAERARAQIAATVSGVEPVVRETPGRSAASDVAAPGLAIQVGSFASRDNADRLLEQLTDQGFRAFIHPDETGSRSIWRVRVGTVADRSEAQDLQAEVLERAGLEGLIVSHP